MACNARKMDEFHNIISVSSALSLANSLHRAHLLPCLQANTSPGQESRLAVSDLDLGCVRGCRHHIFAHNISNPPFMPRRPERDGYHIYFKCPAQNHSTTRDRAALIWHFKINYSTLLSQRSRLDRVPGPVVVRFVNFLNNDDYDKTTQLSSKLRANDSLTLWPTLNNVRMM